MRLCEAAAMDAIVFGNWEASAAWVPPCDEAAKVEVRGYFLCQGCTDALDVLGGLHSVRTAQGRRETRRMLFLLRVGTFGGALAATILLAQFLFWLGLKDWLTTWLGV